MTDARFWFAPGVEVFPGHRVPNPPPSGFCFPVWKPLDVARIVDYSPEHCEPIPHAEFQLTDWRPGGEVVHYELRNGPRAGCRWLVIDGAIHAEQSR